MDLHDNRALQHFPSCENFHVDELCWLNGSGIAVPDMLFHSWLPEILQRSVCPCPDEDTGNYLFSQWRKYCICPKAEIGIHRNFRITASSHRWHLSKTVFVSEIQSKPFLPSSTDFLICFIYLILSMRLCPVCFSRYFCRCRRKEIYLMEPFPVTHLHDFFF